MINLATIDSPPDQPRILQSHDLRELATDSLTPRGACLMGNGRVAVLANKNIFLFDMAGTFIKAFRFDGHVFAKTLAATKHPDQVVVCDQTPDKLYRYDLSGDIAKTVWVVDTEVDPRGVAVDKQDFTWVACKNGNDRDSPPVFGSTQMFTSEGGLVFTVANSDVGPRGIAIDSLDRAWVACLGEQPAGDGNTVDLINRSGVKQNTVTVDTGPFGIVIDANDIKYVACSISDMITKIDAAAAVTLNWFDVAASTGGSPAPLSLGLDLNGNLWISNKSDNAIIQIDTGTAAELQTFDTPTNFLGQDDQPEILGSLTGHDTRVLFPGLDFSGDVSTDYVTAKNKLEQPHPFIWLFELQLNDSEAIRMTPYMRNVEYPEDSGLSYFPYPIEFDKLHSSTDSNLENLTITIGNQDRQLQTHFDNNNGFVDLNLVVRLVHSDLLDLDPLFEETFQVVDCVVDWESATLVLGAFDLFTRKSPNNKFLRDHCRWRYKGPECRYAGPIADCSKFLEGPDGCIAHGDDEVARAMPREHPAQFGGFTYIPKLRQ